MRDAAVDLLRPIDRYLATSDWLQRHRTGVLVLVCLGSLAALLLLPGLKFDMSFRPLFSADPALNAATDRHEREFGQSSGAHVAAILENDRILTVGFLDDLGAMSRRVLQVPHVVEVVSLAQLHRPLAHGGAPRIVNVLDALRGSRAGAAGAPGALADQAGVRGQLLSADGRRTLLLARMDLPLSDLEGRRRVISSFEKTVNASVPPGTRVLFTGVSVVEDAYARLVLRNMLISVVLTVLATAVALFALLGDYRSVSIALAGVAVATPMTLAGMVLIGQPMTIINSMVATMVLIIGVADAIHMQHEFGWQRALGMDVPASIRAMLRHTALPCFTTCGVTALGFLSLQTAGVAALRDFGVNVAIGVALVFVLNQLLVPILLGLWTPARLTPLPWLDRLCGRWIDATNALVAQRTRWLLASLLLVVAVSAYALPQLAVVQRFNEELPRAHPVRAGQAILERDFGGFLGPELRVQRRDGGAVLTDRAAAHLRAVHSTLARQPDVLSLRSPASYWSDGVGTGDLLAWRQASPLAHQLREVIGEQGRAISLVVRVADMGSQRAFDFRDNILARAKRALGDEYTVEVVGQWWLAQHGMSRILSDMLSSLLASGLVIVPLLVVLLRNVPMFVASLVPNVLPVLVSLAYMAYSGITLRIGTAMILAGTIGIAFDDTIHFILRLRREVRAGSAPAQAIHDTIRSTGKAVLLTTLVLMGGFMSMLGNELNAIHDMGQVAAVAFAAGFVADLYLAPAVYLALARRSRNTTRESQLGR